MGEDKPSENWYEEYYFEADFEGDTWDWIEEPIEEEIAEPGEEAEEPVEAMPTREVIEETPDEAIERVLPEWLYP